ncbi:MAG: lytic transglycosylase domain-containing protein, partial [Clostridiales bacterium]|nr:lytic transglycosylase domain-containing protein [Clostridiales bacterium]
HKKIVFIVAAALAAIVIIGAIAMCAIFPNKFANEVNAAAEEFGLDRTLVRAVVWAESKFDKRAVSHKGAQGLMQLMPDTFDECATALLIQNADPYSPLDNLRCGCYYLSLLTEKFDGDTEAALMAYNAGESNAQKFLDGEPIFPETKKYIKDISLARKIYGLFD